MNNYRDIRCRNIYETIIEYKKRNDGNSPSHKQLGDWMGGLSTSIIAGHLRHLEEDGFITRTGKGKSRGICVVSASWVPYDVSILVDALETIIEDECCGDDDCSPDNPKCYVAVALSALQAAGL